MKNIFKSSLLLIGALTLFTACSDDNGSNPTLVEPNSFVLNTPAYAEAGIDLKDSESVNFTWSQPDYGFPAAVDYSMQVSMDGNFTVSVDEAEADEFSETLPDYANVEVQDEDRDLKGSVNAADIAKAMQKIANWTEDEVPETEELYCRMVANTTGARPVYSNVVKINVVPYYVELKDAPIGIWYITGAFTPDGGWKNNADGSNMLPMLPEPGADVDKKTGETILVWAGYIPAGGEFKIIAPAGLANWNYGLCGGNEEGGQVYRDGGDDPGNISYTKGGWVKLTLNTATKELKFEEITGQPASFSTITMPGTQNEWNAASGDPMKAADMVDAHDWSATITFAADAPADGGVKFAANGAWDVNWGAAEFPIGEGTQNGSNIPYKAGTYKVFFNDILGIYYFMAQ